MDEFELEIVSEGGDILGRFIVKRGFSPRAFSALARSQPRVGVVGLGEGYVYLSMGLRMSVEKFITEASAGDVGYSPKIQGLLFFTKKLPDCRSLNSALIGRMLTSLEGIRSLKNGNVVSIIRI
ncbi:MAG: hypothetical protein ACUVQ0_02415 [Thermoproteota archaeon]